MPREKWVAALRSGDYAQAKTVLRRGDRFCCLGVACDVYRQEFPELDLSWKPEFTDPDSGLTLEHETNDLTFMGRVAGLPDAVRDWLGLRDDLGRFDRYPEYGLAALNDHGASFDTIADLVVEEPAGLLAEEPNP